MRRKLRKPRKPGAPITGYGRAHQDFDGQLKTVYRGGPLKDEHGEALQEMINLDEREALLRVAEAYDSMKPGQNWERLIREGMRQKEVSPQLSLVMQLLLVESILASTYMEKDQERIKALEGHMAGFRNRIGGLEGVVKSRDVQVGKYQRDHDKLKHDRDALQVENDKLKAEIAALKTVKHRSEDGRCAPEASAVVQSSPSVPAGPAGTFPSHAPCTPYPYYYYYPCPDPRDREISRLLIRSHYMESQLASVQAEMSIKQQESGQQFKDRDAEKQALEKELQDARDLVQDLQKKLSDQQSDNAQLVEENSRLLEENQAREGANPMATSDSHESAVLSPAAAPSPSTGLTSQSPLHLGSNSFFSSGESTSLVNEARQDKYGFSVDAAVERMVGIPQTSRGDGPLI